MKKIVIIDDELVILNTLKRFLDRFEEFEVETFANAQNALDHLNNHDCDVILSDIMMPGLSGIEILKDIKPKKPHVKVILMTAFSNQHKKEQASLYGASQYLEKPFKSLKEVEEAIRY